MEKVIQNKIEKLVKTSIENIAELVDVNKVVGKPQSIGEKIIVPICKVTTCILSAGGETSEVKLYKDSGEYPFSGGSGAVVSVCPTAFLIYDGKSYKTVNIGKTELDRAFGTIESIVEKIAEKGNG